MARRRGSRRRLRRRRARAVLILALVAATGYGGWQLAKSSLFQLSGVRVVGARRVSARDVMAASGLRIGQTMLGLDLGAVGRAVESALPDVRRARAMRDGATHLRIVIRERMPALLIHSPAGGWLADDAGHLIGRAPPGLRSLPVVRLPFLGEIDPEAAQALASIWDAMDPGMRLDALWFEIHSPSDIRFRLARTAVLFGGPGEVIDKIAALKLVRARVASQGRRLVRIDLTVPSRPAARVA
jgi:cell division septal protein FtsQ